MFHGHGYNVVGDREHSILRSKEQYIFSKILFVCFSSTVKVIGYYFSFSDHRKKRFSMVLVVVLCIGDGCSSAHSV